MGIFNDRLMLIQVDGNRWETARDLEYHVGAKGSEERIRVPKGYKTDLASVPWPATLFIPKSGDYNPAAVIHDYLYGKRGKVIVYDSQGQAYAMLYSRKDCDDIFLEAMVALKVNPFKARIIYSAVRTFGWKAWND